MSDEREQTLSQLFQSHNRQLNARHARYSESEISEISNRLRDMKYENWSRPRIYIVLHAIGELECMKFFVDHGVTDLWFPFTTESLPHGLRPAAHAKFGNAQKIVIPGTFNLESGQHCHLSKDDLDEEMFPRQLEWKATLGSGGFGFVYKVLRRGSSKEYALKQIRRKSGFAETLEVMQYVESELAVLRKLRGRHFVKLLGSYTSPNYVGLIMIPVADDNLASFLSKTLGSIDKKYLLWSFFGCLANALAYLHFTLKIRHKDIKPQNILVKGNNILLTDFGTALDWGDIGQTTTHQELRRSSLYCAPEVGKDELRRSSSDIWSLGCVYLEMITVLRGKTLEEMRSFFDDKGSGMRPFWENQEAIPLWIEVLRDRGSKFENEPLRWIDIMLQQNESDRPDARKLRDLILDSRPDYSGMTFCGACCQNTDPEWSTSHAMQGNLPLADEKAEIALPLADDPTQLLRNHGFDVNGNDSWGLGRAGLHWAAENGYEAAVSLLIDNGSNVEAKDDKARTALHWAAVNGYEKIVQLLMDRSVGINAKDDRGATALFCATINGHEAVVQLLLENRAEIDGKNNCGWSALHIAAIHGYDQVTRHLLEKASDLDVRDGNDWTPLHWAAQMGHVEIARMLLEKGANSNAKDTYDWTPLRRADQRGHEAVAQVLGSKTPR